MSDLTPKEQTNVLTAVRFLKTRCGSWAPLVKALGFTRMTLSKPATPTVAFRVARFAKVSVDEVLTGRFPALGTCPHCGHMKEGAGDV